MRKILMNSAMMPNDGYYFVKQVPKDEFVKLWKSFDGGFVSSIGYEDNARYLTELLGENIPMNRQETFLEDGDILFILKLKYRLRNPRTKGRFTPRDSDYMFQIGKYSKSPIENLTLNNKII